ncbi:MAG: OstA-like protein [Salinivenus sp.]
MQSWPLPMLWWWRALWGVALVVMGLAGGASGAEAQVRPDSADRPVLRAPPAGPDSVRPDDVAAPPTDTSEEERALVNADSLSAQTLDGERVQDLFESVFVQQDTTRLRSNYARRFLDRDRFLFAEDVVIYERGDTLRADTVRYNKNTKVGRARGNVEITDGEVVVRAPRATYYTESKRSVFPDSITLVDSARTLRAQQGTYWSEDKRAEFEGRVRLTDPETYLESDSLTYFRDAERSIARGDVFIRRVEEDESEGGASVPDTTARTYLFGAWADNQEKARYSRVEGRALLVQVRYDSTGAPDDTLALRAHRMDASRSDTHRRLIAVDSVRIWQSDLAAVADSVVYDRVLATGPADTTAAPQSVPDSVRARPQDRGEPRERPSEDPVLPGTDTLAADSSLFLADSTTGADPSAPSPASDPADTTEAARADPAGPPSDTARGTRESLPSSQSAWSRPTADSAGALPLEETRLFREPVTWFEEAQVWGDSIRVRARSRSLDTVFVRGSAFAAQRDTTLDRIHQLSGRTLTAFFRADTLRRIQAQPNARAIRFLADETDALSGALETSADQIVLRFRDQQVHRVSVLGGVESTLYQRPDLIPDPLRLEGFQWTPDRKPTRRELLDEDRVRRRLDLAPRRPPVARRADVSPASPSNRRDAGQTAAPAHTGASRSAPDSTAYVPFVPPSVLPEALRAPVLPRPDPPPTSPPDP